MSFKPGSPESNLVLTVDDIRAMIVDLPGNTPVRIRTGMGESYWAEKEEMIEDSIGYNGQMMDVLVIGASK